MWFKDLFKKEKENNKMEKFEHIKLKCKNCNDIIEGDGKGTYISCTCGKVAVDEVAPYYTRINGNEGDFEVIRDNQKTLYEEGLEKLKRNEEMFLDVKGSDKYQVSNFGRVINKYTRDEISPNKVADTQSPTIYLRDIKGATTTSVSKLVAEAFEIPNPQNSKLCYHIGNIKDNRLDNLTYDRKYQPCYKRVTNKTKDEYSDKNRIDNELANRKIEPLKKEIWKDVIGYERWYEVSSLGNIRRLEKDGSSKLIKPTERKFGRVVSLKTTGSFKQFPLSHIVADAFNIKPTEDNSRVIYHIDGDVNNDCYSNLTYDKKETEAYIEEQRKIKEEQERIEREKQEKENHKEELLNYIEENKEFLKEAKAIADFKESIKKDITIEDVYNKLCEILEVLKK